MHSISIDRQSGSIRSESSVFGEKRLAHRSSSPSKRRRVSFLTDHMMATTSQIFSSVSTTIFSTYSCHFVEDLDMNLLRADFSISCDDDVHLLYQVKPASFQPLLI